jgi:DNA-binding response OmpR family regulator
MAKVLLAGYIPEHLQERERLLRSAGHAVTIAPDFATASAAIGQDTFDVAVLGFSVPEEERNQIARRLKDSHPATKIIMIYFSSVKNTELADALMQTTSTAEDIVRAVNHLLSERNKEKAG